MKKGDLTVNHSSTVKEKGIRFLFYIFLVLVGISVVIPFIWVFSNALRNNSEIGLYTSLSFYTFFPKEITTGNFLRMFEQLPMLQILTNTVFIAAVVTIGSLFINSLTAYAFARINFKGKNFIFFLILSMLVIPIEILIIPLYLTIVKIKLIDSFVSLILPFLAAPFGIFFMRQFFMGVDRTLDEAAILDGCSHFGIFTKIYMPLARTPLFTLGLLVFLQQWDSFIVPVTLINNENKMLLQVALTRLSMGLYTTDYGVLYAGVTLSVVPIMIIYLLFQKQIVESIASVGIKG